MESARMREREAGWQRTAAAPQRVRSIGRCALLALALALLSSQVDAVWTGFGDVRSGCNGTVYALAPSPNVTARPPATLHAGMASHGPAWVAGQATVWMARCARWP